MTFSLFLIPVIVILIGISYRLKDIAESLEKIANKDQGDK